MKREMHWRRLAQLFRETFLISAFTFGGGFVIVPLMRKKFVENLHWLGDEEMMDIAAIAQSSPGAIVVNASILLGYRVAGVAGGLVAVLGSVLPPLIILSVISLFYAAFRNNRYVSLVMRGMQAGVAAVVCDVVLTMGQALLKTRRALYIVMMALGFGAAVFFDVNAVAVILACGLVGAWDAVRRHRGRKAGGWV